MATNKLQWKRIAKGDKLPCQSFLRKKNGEILKLSTGAGVTVGQDAYYLPVDEVIEEIKNYPIEENEDEKIKQELIEYHKAQAFLDGKPNNKHVKFVAWLEKQGDIPTDAVLDSNKDGLIADTIRYKREKQGEQKHQYISRPKYIGEEELLGEQKPAEWGDEDEDNFKHLIDEIVCLGNSRNSANRLYYDKLIKFLHELKNRAQPREEWRDKDERMLDRLIAYFEKRVAFTDDDNPRYANWLKFLRPQSHWKPSDEQITVLHDVAAYIDNSTYPNKKDVLVNLYLQLKKLREE